MDCTFVKTRPDVETVTIVKMERICRLPLYAFYFLLVYMPFHIFLSQWLSAATGGLEAWKIGKDLVLPFVVFMSVVLVYAQEKFANRLFWIFAGISWVYFLLHLFLWQANLATGDKPALLATAYNGRLLGFAILGWAAAILAGKYLDVSKVFKIAVIISAIVAVLGVIQYNLPKDFMQHLGYSLDRGVKPAFFIDDKPDLPRIMSTLRDPNSLGAYLILPITVLVGAWLRRPKLRMLLSGLLLLNGLALLLTFSRSAWLGALLAVVIMAIWHHKDKTKEIIKKYWLFLVGGLVILALGIFLLRDQYVVQNIVFHSDENTRQTDSNNLHADYAQQGIEGIVDEPLGHGPGTAGLVSIQTDNVVLTENYFIQIAYEVGIFGLMLLFAAMFIVCRELYRANNFYAHALLASFVGITLCAMFLHTWSNEAVAAQWWLLAGLVVGGLKGRAVSSAGGRSKASR